MGYVAEQLLRHNPAEPRLLRTARQSYRMRNQPAKALKFSARLRKSPKANQDDIREEAELLLCQNKPGKALRLLKKNLQTDPFNKDYLALSSDGWRVKGKRERSLHFSRLLIKHHPQSWRGYQRGAEDLIALERCEDARMLLRHGIRKLHNKSLARGLAQRLQLEQCEDLFSNQYTRPLIEGWISSYVWSDPQGQQTPISRPLITKETPTIRTSIQFTNPIETIQYWSQGKPSPEIQRVTARWNEILTNTGLGKIKLFSKESARQWISRHTPQYLRSFDTAFHYAIESDIFRIAYASRRPCLYLDCDQWPHPWTQSLIKDILKTGHSCLCLQEAAPAVNNGFFLAQENCPFFQLLASRCEGIDFATLPISTETVLNTFGPNRYNMCLRELLQQEPEPARFQTVAAGITELIGQTFKLTLLNERVCSAVRPPDGLSYKQTAQQWQIFISQNNAAQERQG